MQVSLDNLSVAGAAAIALAVLWWVLLLAEWAARLTWRWVDDAKEVRQSVIERLIMAKWLGHSYTPERYQCWSKDTKETDGSFHVMLAPAFLLGSVPILLLLGYRFPWVFATLGVLALVLFISRALRRLLKRFEAHEKDTNAHK